MRWDLAAEDIGRKAEELMVKSKAAYDAVGAVKAEEANIDNVVKVNKFSFLIYHKKDLALTLIRRHTDQPPPFCLWSFH